MGQDLIWYSKITVCAVDYVQSLLITEPIYIIQDIVNGTAHESTQKWLSILQLVVPFSRIGSKYVTKTPVNCATHDLKYGLDQKSNFDKTMGTIPLQRWYSVQPVWIPILRLW